MPTLAIALGALVLYLVAYHTYGKWLARKIFKLDANAMVPSVALNDDKDYVPTDKSIIFGHHFTSIAGTGPIVGPALAVIWGWVPALLWVLLGSILIGAVHDFGSLVVSIRNRGQTVGDIAGRVLTPRTRLLFLSILFMALTIVLAIFGLVIAAVFKAYPAAIFPCLVQIPIALIIGTLLHRRGINILIPSLIALAIMYVTVYFGNQGFLQAFNETLKGWSIITWVAVLLIYSYVASVLPVWSLLQPRDYINSLQLLSALGLVVIGLIVAAISGGAPLPDGGESQALEIVAPALNLHPQGAPFIFPFLFITIACGAISGFHCLVSSGTSSKQIKCETECPVCRLWFHAHRRFSCGTCYPRLRRRTWPRQLQPGWRWRNTHRGSCLHSSLRVLAGGRRAHCEGRCLCRGLSEFPQGSWIAGRLCRRSNGSVCGLFCRHHS